MSAAPAPRVPEEEHVSESEAEVHEPSPVEDALTDLLAGPFDKVSITMPAALRARIAARAADTNFSAYIAEVLARDERRRALIDYLDYMDELYGPPSAQAEARLDRKLEQMWARFEASRSAQ